jgi:hypothetical protein
MNPLIQFKFFILVNSTLGLFNGSTVGNCSLNFPDKPQFNVALIPTNLNKPVKDKCSLLLIKFTSSGAYDGRGPRGASLRAARATAFTKSKKSFGFLPRLRLALAWQAQRKLVKDIPGTKG